MMCSRVSSSRCVVGILLVVGCFRFPGFVPFDTSQRPSDSLSTMTVPRRCAPGFHLDWDGAASQGGIQIGHGGWTNQTRDADSMKWCVLIDVFMLRYATREHVFPSLS